MKPDNGSGERCSQPADRSAYSCVFESSLNVEPLCSQKQDSPPTRKDFRTELYEKYHEADECDQEFIKRRDVDLDTTLIFVLMLCPLSVRCADSAYRRIYPPP